MKKLLTTLACLVAFASGVLSAQVAQYSLDLQPFINVDVSGPFKASIVRGTQYRLRAVSALCEMLYGRLIPHRFAR